MDARQIVVTTQDLERLREVIQIHRRRGSEKYEYLHALEAELSKAEVVAPDKIPSNVVTMNCTVEVQATDTRQKLTYTIVYPEDADIDEDRISVLAPLGTALLGYRQGDVIEWTVPAGKRKYRILRVSNQPEEAGQAGR